MPPNPHRDFAQEEADELAAKKAKQTEIVVAENKSTPAPVIEGQNNQNLSVLGQMAMRVLAAPDADIETLERTMKLLREQEEYERGKAIEDREWAAKLAFTEAFAAAQNEMPHIAKNKKNEHSNYGYANLEAVYLAVVPVATKNGFSMTFKNGMRPIDSNHYHAILTVTHAKGHQEVFEDHVPLTGVGTSGNKSMTATHAHGATKTYARRYLTLDVWNPAVMEYDSDGNANNISDPAQVFLNRISDCEDLETIQKISEDISTAGNKLSPVDMPKVRKAWANKKHGIEDRLKRAS